MSVDPPNHVEELMKGFWRENPVFIAALGLCPAMAVTNSFMNGLVMGLASTFVLVGSSCLVSALRRFIPKAVRITIFIIIIATFVTMVDFALAALLPEAHRQLGAFISLIVVNCLILGRQEAFASRQPLSLALADALGMSAGFTLALVSIGSVREILGTGSLAGVDILGPNFEPWAIMVLPPGGFFCLGLLIAGFAWFEQRKPAEAETDAGERS